MRYHPATTRTSVRETTGVLGRFQPEVSSSGNCWSDLFFHWWCGHCGYYTLIRCICIYIYIHLHMVVSWVIVYKVIQCYNMIMGKMTVNDHGARAESCRVAERLCAPFVGAPVHGLRASNWHRRCGLMVIVDDIRSYWSEQEAGCVYPKQVLSSIQFTRNK